MLVKREMSKSLLKVAKEALQLYKDKISATKNPSYFAGAYQHVATALIDCKEICRSWEKYFIEGERIS